MMTKGLENAIQHLSAVEVYILGKMRDEYTVDAATVAEVAEYLASVQLFLTQSVLESYQPKKAKQ